MRTFVVGTEVEAGIAVTIPMQTDDVQTTKEPLAAQMRFWDGFWFRINTRGRHN